MIKSSLQKPTLNYKSIPNINTISSIQQTQSRGESRIFQHYQFLDDQCQVKSIQLENIQKWLSLSRNSNSQLMFELASPYYFSDLFSKYEIDSQSNRYFQLCFKKLVNLQISLRQFGDSMRNPTLKSSKKTKNSDRDFYLQFQLEFIDLNIKNSIKSVYLSQYYRLEQSQTLRQRYEMNEQIKMYFYYKKCFQKIALRINFFCIFCQKQKSVKFIVDKQSIGTIFINLDDDWKGIYFLKNKIQSYFDCEGENQSDQHYNQKNDQFAEFRISESADNGFPLLSMILLPFKIYTNNSKFSFLRSGVFPKDSDFKNIRFALQPYTLNFQLISVKIPQSQIAMIKNKFQSLIQSKYYEKLKRNQIEIKQWRMVLNCHNGEKIISSFNSILKKLNSKTQTRHKKYNDRKRDQQQKQYVEKSSNRKEAQQFSSEDQLNLYSEGVELLDLVFNAEGVVLICQIFCLVQGKINFIDSKSISQSTIFPVCYFIKPIISLENDVHYSDTLFYGELLGKNGLQTYLKQMKKKIEDIQKPKINPGSNFSSYKKILSKALAMTNSVIQFYIFKQKKDHSSRYYSTIEDQKSMTLSLSIVNKANGNEINKLIMEKARIQRQRQKMQQKINKMRIQNNKSIMLLDPTQIKGKIYHQNLKQMREKNYQLKTTLNYLRSKIEKQDRKRFLQKEMIQDTLGKVFGHVDDKGNQSMKLGQKLIGARGGVCLNEEQKFLRETVNSKMQDQLRVIIPQNLTFIRFSLNLSNLMKLINYLKKVKLVEFVLTQQKFYSLNNKIKKILVYCGFQTLQKCAQSDIICQQTQSNLPGKAMEYQNKKQFKFALDFPQVSSNLLALMLYSPLCLYVVDKETESIIGTCYNYLTEMSNLIMESSQNQKSFTINSCSNYVYEKSQIIAKIDISIQFHTSIHQTQTSKQFNLISQNLISSLNDQLESNLLKQKQPDQKRKLMRIQNFKKVAKKFNPSDTIKLKSVQENKKEQSVHLSSVFSQLNGQIYQVNYHSLNYNILKITLQNSTSTLQPYKLSIKDPDSAYFKNDRNDSSINFFQELRVIGNEQFIKSEQKLLKFNNQVGALCLEGHEKGVLLLQYSSRRHYFPCFLNKFQAKNILNKDETSQVLWQSLLKTYNHKRTINVAVANEDNIVKVINVNVNPIRDSNTIHITYYFPFQTEFIIPLPYFHLISKDNIYFSHEEVDLVIHEQNIFLCGFAPHINQVHLLQFFAFPRPQLFGKLTQELQNPLHRNQYCLDDLNLIQKLLNSEKILNLSFEVWGCQKIKTFYVRLFEENDVLWEIPTIHLIVQAQQSQQSEQCICLYSLKPNVLGFRSTKNPSKILSHKKMSNQIYSIKEQKILVKSVIASNKVKKENVIVQARSEEIKKDVICRYIVEINTQQPYCDKVLDFTLQFIQLQKILTQNRQINIQKEEQRLKCIKKSFLIDVSILFNSKKTSNNEKYNISEQINLIRFHTTQNYLKILEISEEHNSSIIRQFIDQKPKQIENRQKSRDKKSRRIEQQKSLDKIERKVRRQKQNKNIKSIYQFKPIIAQITIELDVNLFGQFIKNKQRLSSAHQEKHFGFVQNILLNCLDESTPLASVIFGLSSNQSILYYQLNIVQQSQTLGDQKAIDMVKRLLEKSQSYNSRVGEKNTRKDDNKKDSKSSMKPTNMFGFLDRIDSTKLI